MFPATVESQLAFYFAVKFRRDFPCGCSMMAELCDSHQQELSDIIFMIILLCVAFHGPAGMMADTSSSVLLDVFPYKQAPPGLTCC